MSNDNAIIYLDNAATSWPKPKLVIDSVNQYFAHFPGSPHRTSNGAGSSTNLVEDTRTQLKRYFDAPDDALVAFVPSATIGMNLILQSLLQQGDHVVTTNAEHHCVYRPLHYLSSLGVEYSIVDYVDSAFIEHPERIIDSIKPNTKVIVMNHGSNVTGMVYDVRKVGEQLKESDIRLVVDVSQTAGIEDVSMAGMHADIITASGHKHMFGLPGLGFILFEKGINLKPLFFGGTGKSSSKMYQPENLPYVLEAGTMNLPGILALRDAMAFTDQCFRARARQHVLRLLNRFLELCADMKEISCYYTKEHNNSGIVSFKIQDADPTFMVTPYLHSKGILIRSGLHCSPLIHKAINTYPYGTNRISFSIFNNESDVSFLVEQLKELVRGMSL